MLGLMALYTTQRKQYVCSSGQSNHRVASQQESGLEMRNLALSEFHYLGHSMTADCRDDMDIKKQFRIQNVVGNMLVTKFSFAPIEAKIQLFRSYCYPIYGCSLWRHHFRILLENLLLEL